MLTRQEFSTLHEQRDKVRWDAGSAELMLRCSIELEMPKGTICEWVRTFEKLSRDLGAPEALRALRGSRDQP